VLLIAKQDDESLALRARLARGPRYATSLLGRHHRLPALEKATVCITGMEMERIHLSRHFTAKDRLFGSVRQMSRSLRALTRRPPAGPYNCAPPMARCLIYYLSARRRRA
jgi:hypothetical protein